MKSKADRDIRVQRKIVGVKQFAVTYAVMMLLVGVQVGIIVFPGFIRMHEIFQVGIIMAYWALVALVFCLLTNWQIKKGYDIPMRRLSEAARKVAGGDFSVYAEPSHTPDRYDYLDVMFLDFNTMVQELGSIETLKNDFVANVSHEIKTPLAIIKNYSTVLRGGDLQENSRAEYLDTIIEATDKLSALVSNVLRLNKLENQEIEAVPAPAPFDLCRQLSECAFGFEAPLEQKNLAFSAQLEERVIIAADESMLEIVWNNLLSNAIKFTQPGGSISLVQLSDAKGVTVSVTDTGCGMNPQTIKHIFEKFYQADASHAGEGNGLGLAIAYRVVEKMHGSLTVTSEVGGGSTFTVTLPHMN
jgi:Signal transduction histidine kinase